MTFNTIYAKPIVSSKVFWVNLVVIVAALLTQLTDMNLPFTTEQWFLGLVALVNIALRFLTKKPVTIRGGEPVPVEMGEGRKL